MAEAVYLLCMLTSAGCALALLRTYFRRGSQILLWSSVCFVLLAANNAVLFLDLVVMREIDLSVWRASLGAAASLALVVALISDLE
jgi:hypothetical protein